MPEPTLRVLLVNTNRFHDPMPLMPIGLCMVAASLRRAGHEVAVLDLCFSRDPAADIRARLAGAEFDFVGLSIRNIDTCNGFQPRFLAGETGRDIVEPLKAAFGGPIVLGGAASGINGPELLELFGLEYAAHGDGEAAMVEFARRLAAGEELGDCPGMAVRRGGAVAVNPALYVEDLDSLPPPAVHEFLDLAAYRAFGAPYSIQSKRGCALRCSYCTYNRIEGCRYRMRSPRLVAWEIAEFVAATDYRRVEFVDSTFNVPPEHAKAVLREIVKLNLDLSLSTMGLSPRFVDEELLDLMRQAGFMDISVGIEAGNETSLRGLGKDFGVADIERAAALVRRAKIPAMWYLLLGGPGETEATVRQSLRLAARVVRVWDVVNIGVGLRVYKGSPIADGLAAAGRGSGDGFLRPAAYRPDGLSLPRIKELAAWACLLHHNFLMFDDGANVPPDFARWFAKTFPRQPIWRAYVVSRLVERCLPVWPFRLLAEILLIPARRRSGRLRHASAMAPDPGP